MSHSVLSTLPRADRAHGVGAVRLRRSPRVLNGLIGFLFSIPVFFTLYGPTSIGLGKVRAEYESAGQTLPISTVILCALMGLWFIKSLARSRFSVWLGRWDGRVARLVALYLFFNVLAYLVGSLLSDDLAGVLFLGQVALPACAVLVPLITVRTHADLEQWLRWAFIGMVIGAGMLFVINYLNYGPGLIGQSWVGDWEKFGVYQADSVVPNVFATFIPIGLAFALASPTHRARAIAAVALAFLTIVVVHMRSVTAVLIVLVAAPVMAYMGKHLKVWRPRIGHLLLAAVVAVGPIVFWRSSPLSQEAQYKLRAAETEAPGKGGVNVRLAKYRDVAGTVLDSPIWGKGYRADYSEDLGGLVDSRVGKSHNQFLDIAQKAGLPALLLFLALMIFPVVACFQACKRAIVLRERVIGIALLAALMASVTVHNVTVVPYVQPYSGILLYSLAGLAVRYASLTPFQVTNANDVTHRIASIVDGRAANSRRVGMPLLPDSPA